MLKKDCSLTKSHYRPLSIAIYLHYQKVLERLVEIGVSQSFNHIHHKFVFASVMGLSSLAEQWRKTISNFKIFGLVSMDLSKSFDIIPHDRIVLKDSLSGGYWQFGDV